MVRIYRLRVQAVVLLLFALARRILADRRLTPVATHRVAVVAARPERAAPQLRLDRRYAQEHLAGRDALDRPRDLGRAVGRDRLEQEMNVVTVSPDLKERDLVAVTAVEAVADVEAYLLERPTDLSRDHRPPVLGRADQVIE